MKNILYLRPDTTKAYCMMLDYIVKFTEEGVKFEASRSDMTITTDDTRMVFRSVKTLNPRYFLGVRWNDVVGLDLIEDIDVKNHVLATINRSGEGIRREE